VIGACALCGQLIAGRPTELRILNGPLGTDPAEEARQIELQEFDALAAETLKHIAARHPAESQELTAVANLSSKVYAMRNCSSSDENFFLLRSIWADTICRAVFARFPIQDARATGDDSSSSSSSSGSGSYEKNSPKNFSN